MAKIIQDATLQGIADAIRFKTSGTAAIRVDAFASKIREIPTGGVSFEKDIITRTISGTYSNDEIKYVGSYAFYLCRVLGAVNFPACTTIYGSAFCSCSSLTSASFPVCTSIGTSAFYCCTSLTSASFPVCTSIDSSAFYYCSSLTSALFPVCTTIGSSAFYSCSSLTAASFPVCTSIGSNAFVNCTKLLSLYLGASTVCQLSRSNVFYSTPIAGYTESTGGAYGSVFVPASLVSAYKSATNWTYFADRITAIPE